MKTITLECITSNAGICELFPISPAKRYVPQWFKDIKAVKSTSEFGIEADLPTLKRCDGVTKLYNNGWVLPLWCDYIIETDDEGGYRWTVPSRIEESTIEQHSREQIGNAFDDYVHCKITAPWYIQEKTGVDFYFGGNTWGIKEHWDDIIILPGIVNFKNQHGAHINMFVKKNRRVELEHNTPIIYCVPLMEAKLEIKNSVVSDEEYKHLKQYSYGFSFAGLYKKRLKLKNERK